MEVSFSKNNDAPAAVPVTEQHTVTTSSVGLPVQQDSGGLVVGDKVPTFGEIILPRINLVQNSGNLKDSFQPGALIYGQTTVLYTPPVINKQTSTIEKAGTAPLVLTVLGFRPTRYVEKVPGGGRGLLVHTLEQVRAAGGTCDYNEWRLKSKDGMRRFEYLADAFIAIERPETVADDDTLFVYEVDGKKIAIALWSLKGASYTRAAKAVFFTQRSIGCLKGGYPAYSFAVTTRTEPSPDRTSTYFVPVCIPNKKSTEKFLKWASESFGAESAGNVGGSDPEAAE